jgi:hypothetical protein
VVSIALIALGLPFVIRVERIGQRAALSLAATIISLGVYLGLFLTLFFTPLIAVAAGAGLGLLAWVVLGGLHLLRTRHMPLPQVA